MAITIFSRRLAQYLGITVVILAVALYFTRPDRSDRAPEFSSPLGSFAEDFYDPVGDYKTAPHHDDFPTVNTVTTTDHRALNRQHLRDLYTCLALGNCGRNQATVILLGERWFYQAVDNGCLAGEHIWSHAMMRALRHMGYTYFVGADADDTLNQYSQFPNLVKLVIGGWALENWGAYIKTERNPTGIPRWKIFDMAFFPWGGRTDELGYEWAVHAERPGPKDPEHKSINYIGYSMEEECQAATVVPHDQRPMSAWFYAKQATYAYSHFPEFGWNRSYFEMASRDLDSYGLTFRGAYAVDDNFLPDRIVGGPMEELAGVHNLGNIGKEAFQDEIARTRIIVGIGQPWLAPSAYLGLCLGSPFLNVLKRWNEDEPDDKTQWSTQHDVLAALDPPYVYNVRAGDYDGFVAAIRDALTHPTPPWMDPEMTEIGVRERMGRFLETDWRSKAETLWQERDREGQRPHWLM